jgi:hypothetical protein
MTTISSLPVIPAGTTASKAAADPNELVGSGDASARWMGGLVGAGVGVGAAAGLTKLTSSSSLAPVRIAGVVGALGAVGGGAFLGQRLLGSATRETQAESTRAQQAKQHDLQLEIRTLQAEASGSLTKDERARVDELRGERTDLAESRPGPNALGKYVIPAVLGLGLMAGAATIAGRLTPDDGKGINAMFNAMMAGGFGGAFGAWAGLEAGEILTSGPHLSELPKETTARIAAIDSELDGLLG